MRARTGRHRRWCAVCHFEPAVDGERCRRHGGRVPIDAGDVFGVLVMLALLAVSVCAMVNAVEAWQR